MQYEWMDIERVVRDIDENGIDEEEEDLNAIDVAFIRGYMEAGEL